MDLWTMLGVSRQVALGGALAAVVVAIVAARVIGRRSGGRARSVVSLNGHD